MPTYDYVCDNCEHAFEEFQSMSAKPLRKCPECGKSKLRRLIGTGAGVIFKGGGFYETDYRSESYKKDAKADKPADTSEKKSNDSKSDSGATDKAKPTSGNSPGAQKPEAKPAKAPSKDSKKS